MSNRVSKPRSKPRSAQVERRDALLEVLLVAPVAMDSVCLSCEKAKSECLASEDDSSRCTRCVRYQLSNCDMKGLSPQQLRRVAAHHTRFEAELVESEEKLLELQNIAQQQQNKVLRLRRQKKLWFEKMMRAVARGIDDVEELERIEREEAEREAIQQQGAGSSDVLIASSSEVPGVDLDWSAAAIPSQDAFNSVDWNAVFDENSSVGAGRSSNA